MILKRTWIVAENHMVTSKAHWQANGTECNLTFLRFLERGPKQLCPAEARLLQIMENELFWFKRNDIVNLTLDR